MKMKLKILFSSVLVLILVAGSTGTALATLSGGSTFESGDGDLAPNTSSPPAPHDWNAPVDTITCPNTIPGSGANCGTDLKRSGADNAFGQGAKEDIANPTEVTGSIPPQKSDLTRFYINKEKVGTADFLYLAWERSNVLGSANMDFEFNQTATTPPGKVTPLRTAGDLLIRFDFTQGGGNPILSLLRWLTTGSASDCFKNNSLPCWGVTNAQGDLLDGADDEQINLSAAGFAEGAVNTVTVHDNNPPPAGGFDLPALTFGEAGINLTGADVFPPGQCRTFGAAFLKSRSSAAFDAELKDFIAPVPVNITNCGTVNIHKQDDVGTPLADAVFTLFTDNAPLDGAPPHGAEDVATSFTCTTNASGDCTIHDVPFGNYWAVETTGVPNHDLAPDQSFSLTAQTPNLTISLTFVDPRQPGAIKVTKTRKHAADGPGDHPHAGVSITINGVTKTTDANGEACFDGLDFGDYTVHETVPTGYHVDANDQSVTVDNTASCSDATYVGETVTFHNTPLTDITVSVNSQIDGGTSSTIDCVVASGSTGANGDGSVTASDLEPGTYVCTVVIDP